MKRVSSLPILIVFLTIAAFSVSSNFGMADAEAESGWQRISHNKYTFQIPNTWKEDADTDVWAPKDKILNMGRPKTSLHVGAIPPIPGKNQDALLAFYYGSVPEIGNKVKKCGLDGFFVKIDTRGYKHLGLILVEEVGPMKLLHFFDCQSPDTEFSKQQETFMQILDSVKCD